jgi:hypothetical protein
VLNRSWGILRDWTVRFRTQERIDGTPKDWIGAEHESSGMGWRERLEGVASMAEDRDSAKAKREGKSGTRGTATAELGPIDGRTVQFPRPLWKEVSKKAIDLDISTSALIVRMVRTGMARFGPANRAETGQDGEAKESGEAIPMSETVTSSDPTFEDSPRGEGEGACKVEATSRPRRRV